jgi:hypothetical protein
MATSSDPGGGVNAAVVTVVCVRSDADAGLEASSVIVPKGRISRSAVWPPMEGALAPMVVAPGVPVTAVARHAPRISPFGESTMLSNRVVVPAAVSVVELLVFSAPYTREPVTVVVIDASCAPVPANVAVAPIAGAATPVRTLTRHRTPVKVEPLSAAVTVMATSHRLPVP